MKNSIYFLVFIIAALSCARITFHDSKTRLDINNEDNSTCSVKRSPVYLYGDNEKLNDQFSKFIDHHKIAPLESMLYWNIVQLTARPDATTINSQILSIFKINGKVYQVVYLPKGDNQATFIAYLNDITKLSSSLKLTKSLKKLSRLNKSKHSLNQIPISLNLQKYLEEHKVSLYKNKKLRSIYFKGNQLVKEGESIPLIKMKDVLAVASKMDKGYLKFNKLFDHPKNLKCNFDHRLYKNYSPILERKSLDINSNYYGLFKDKDNFFITVTSSLSQEESILEGQLLLKSKKINQLNAAICLSSNDKSIFLAKNIAHSQQLLNNVLMSSSSLEAEQIINTKRFINLKFPIRSLVEVYGTPFNNESQALESTIYNIPTLGRIDIIETRDTPMLFRDPRRGDLKCN